MTKTEKEPFVFLRPCPIEKGGEFNGYVSLPAGHPWYGKDYDDIPADVHGGLTYAAVEDGRWVIGFDTAHFGDENRNWNRENVTAEAERLLEQAIEARKLQPFSGSLCKVSPETLDKLIERYSDNGYTNQYGEELIVDLTHIIYDKEIVEEFLELTGLREYQLGNDDYITFYY